MKKPISVLLAVLMLLAMCSVSAFACEYDACDLLEGKGCPSGCALCDVLWCNGSRCLCWEVSIDRKESLENFWWNWVTPVRNWILSASEKLFGEPMLGGRPNAPLTLPYA